MHQNGCAARRSALVGVVVSIAAVVLALSACAPRALNGQARTGHGELNVPVITGMRAHLFENDTGRLSDDVLGPTPSTLRNTIAGANSANATLIIVEVSGPPSGTFNGFYGPETKYMVRLIAREGRRKLLLDQTQVIPVLSGQGKTTLAFLIRQSGCVPVRLTATMVGPQPGSPLERSLDFACGE